MYKRLKLYTVSKDGGIGQPVCIISLSIQLYIVMYVYVKYIHVNPMQAYRPIFIEAQK